MERYQIISLDDSMVNGKIPWYIRCIGHKRWENYVRKHLPHRVEKVIYLGEPGINIIIPLLQKRDGRTDLVLQRELVEKMIERYDLDRVIYDQSLTQLMNISEMAPTWIIRYIMFRNIYEETIRLSNIKRQDVRLVIIDEESRKIEYIVESVMEELNYLTILTHRPERFQLLQQKVYEETGLVIDVVDKESMVSLQGNLVVDLCHEGVFTYSCFSPDTYVIEMTGSEKKMALVKELQVKQKVLESVDVLFGRDQLQLDMASRIMCYCNWPLHQFAHYQNVCLAVTELSQIREKYDMSLLQVQWTKGETLCT